MLKALGFLALHEGVYQLTDPARLYLLKRQPLLLGTHARHRPAAARPPARPAAGSAARAAYRARSRASPARKGPGSVGSWASGQVDMERARRVAAAMQSHSLPAAIAMARNGDFAGVTRLLDVGGGSGCFAIALALQHPSLRCTIMELPTMCEVAAEYIADGGVAGRVDTVAVDMFREPWPRGYDAMFFSNVFHDWNFETCRWLARARPARRWSPAGASTCTRCCSTTTAPGRSRRSRSRC